MTKFRQLINAIEDSRFVFVCGNGGSSATAEHLTNDLFSKGIKAICLNSNTSIMTMIANDFGYKYTFSKQLEVFCPTSYLVTDTDMLITISCSGTSPNIIEAQKVAKSIGMYVCEFETFKKGKKDYGKLEDKHLQLVHQIKNAL